MSGQDQGQAAARALGRQAAHLAAAARAQVSVPARSAVAGAEAGLRFHRAGREAHHQQRRGRLGLGRNEGRGGEFHHQLAEVRLVEDDGVVAAVVVVVVGLGDQFGADGDLGREPDDAGADLVLDQVRDRDVDVVRVAGVEGAEDDEDLARAVGRGVEEARARHLQRILQARMAARVLLAELVQRGPVLVRVAGHGGDAHGEPIAHADDAELGDGVLLEEFRDEVAGVAEREEVAARSEVFFQHRDGEVEDEDDVADDSSLEGGGVFQ